MMVDNIDDSSVDVSLEFSLSFDTREQISTGTAEESTQDLSINSRK